MPRSSRLGRWTALALLLAAVAPASAPALTITTTSGGSENTFFTTQVSVAGTAAAERVSIFGDGGGVVIRASAPQVSFSLGERCQRLSEDEVNCVGALNRLSGDLGGGDDFADVSARVQDGGPIGLSLGEGADRGGMFVSSFSAAGLSWSLDGGPGADEVSADSFAADPVHVTGGEGDDHVEGTPFQVLDAGAGDDVVEVTDEDVGARTAGSAAGGPGRDLVIAGQPAVPLGLKLSGGVASLGAGDGGTQFPDSTSGFESLRAGFSVTQARLEGDDGPNGLFACGGATLIGNGGDDDLRGNSDQVGDACAATSDPNAFSGGPGADRVEAQNGIAENVDCGAGVDTQVRADATDTLVDCEATGVSFTQAPSGFVASTSATFAWEAPDAPPGASFECSLDGAAFTACTSPRTLTALDQGEHGFRVRVVSGGVPGPPAERRWTVDTVKPVVRFTQAPSGEGNPSDVDIAWEADEPATFACSQDGAPDAACTSPARLSGLAPGPHSFSVLATDRAGNVAEQRATASWVVGGSGPQPPPGPSPPAPGPAPPPPGPVACPQGTQAVVTVGVVTARALSEAACFRPAPEISPTALRARGPVLVNGLRITPRSGAFTIDRTLSGGEIGTTGPWTLGIGRVDLELDTPLGLGGLASAAQQLVQRNVQILTRDTPKALGLPLRGSIGLEFSADNGGQSRASLTVELPNVFRGTPDGGVAPGPVGTGAQDVTIEVSATASNDRGVFFSGRGRLDTLYLFGKLKLKNLEVAVDQGAGTFRGSVGISLADSTGGPPVPGVGGDALLTATVEIGPDGLFGTELRKLSLQASDLSVRVHPIVFLQRVGAELSAGGTASRPFAILSGNAGISFGPKLEIPPLFEGEVASIDGTIRLSVPAFLPPESFSIEVEGIGKLVEFEVARARVRYTTPARVEMEGRLDLTAGGFGLLGEIRRSFFDGATEQWSVEAAGGLRVPGLGLGQGLDLQSEAVLSDRGYAACAGNQGERFGFGRLWGGELQTFFDTCDLGPFRSGAATAAGAGSTRAFTVRPGTRVLTVAVRGASGPPKTELRGPGAVRLATPQGPEPARSAAGLVVQDPERRTTWFILRRPEAGTWRAAPLAGSTVTRVQVADPLPPVRLRARVTGKGPRRTLVWSGLPRGHRLVVGETGAGTTRTVLTTARARGRTTFTPMPGHGRTRTLTALVTRQGIPRLQRTIARYTTPRAARLRPVTRLRRTARLLTWQPSRGARHYALSLLLADGTTITRTVSKPRTALPESAARTPVTATIVPLAADGRTGPPARARLKPPPARRP